MPEQPIAFIGLDIETTGLRPNEEILEVGLVFFSADLLPLYEHTQLIVSEETDEILDQLAAGQSPRGVDPFVVDMHTKTGLWDELRGSKGSLDNHGNFAASSYDEADDLLSGVIDDALSRWPSAGGKFPVLGSSVHFDLYQLTGRFPKLLSHFSHRHIDASSFTELLKVIDPESADFAINAAEQAVEQAELTHHRATSDVIRSALLIKSVCFYGGLGDKFLYPDDVVRGEL